MEVFPDPQLPAICWSCLSCKTLVLSLDIMQCNIKWPFNGFQSFIGSVIVSSNLFNQKEKKEVVEYGQYFASYLFHRAIWTNLINFALNILYISIFIYCDINRISKLAYTVNFGIGYMNFTLLENVCFQFLHGYIVFKFFNE